MKFRYHRGSLREAMKTVIEVKDIAELRVELTRTLGETGLITIDPYGFDERIGWNTHIVCLNGIPVGWTDGPLDNLPQ